MAAAILSQSTLKSLLHYCPETGVFTRLVSTNYNAIAGSIAGSVSSDGYLQIQITGKAYQAHRLAWLYMYGAFPPKGLDHKNRIKTDNRIGNLRLATQAENLQNASMLRNNTSGHKGIYWSKRERRWKTQITTNNKRIYLGRFTNLEEAIQARKAAELKYHNFNTRNPNGLL